MVMVHRSGCRGTENGERVKIGNLLTLQHLLYRNIRRHSNHLVDNLDREMQVAELPCDARRIRRDVAERNLKDRLLPLADRIKNALFPQNEITVGEQMIEIEAKLPSVTRNGAPAALGEDLAIHRDRNDAIGFRPMDMQVMTNDFHTQNKKYLWAIGKTSAGAQRSSTPSAFTV